MNRRECITVILTSVAAPLMAGCGGGGSTAGNIGGGVTRFAGRYAGAATLQSGQVGVIDFTAASSGQISGTMTVTDPTRAASRAVIGVAAVTGAITSSSGAFQVSGSYSASGSAVPVSASGVVPASGRSSAIQVVVNSNTYTASLGAAPVSSVQFSSVSGANANTTDFALDTAVTQPNVPTGDFIALQAVGEEAGAAQVAGHRSVILQIIGASAVQSGESITLSHGAPGPAGSVHDFTFEQATDSGTPRSWSASGGQVLFDMVTTGATNALTFRIVNAAMLPNASTGAQGTFTLNGTFHTV
ncbi:MAG TPA: hypothetical protein VKT77_17565 [Chthonomonadaceae bacterium]|nr:hypothetical protein [Chthonomonadaceae bacterium]